jgi:hypothetical protein
MCPPYCSGWGSKAMHLEQAIAALRFDPAIPIWALAALAVLALLANGFAAWRGARGTILRGAAFAVLVLWLAGPRLVEETRETLPDIGLLVVDQTASMSVGDRPKLAETARAAIVEQAARLPDLELRVLTVPERGDNGTQLFGAIAGHPPVPLRRHHRHHRRAGPRHSLGRSRRRADQCADPRDRGGNRPPPSGDRGAEFRHRR